MTAITIRRIECDDKRCIHSHEAINEDEIFEDIRNRLRRKGWKIDRDRQKEYCPSCAEKMSPGYCQKQVV